MSATGQTSAGPRWKVYRDDNHPRAPWWVIRTPTTWDDPTVADPDEDVRTGIDGASYETWPQALTAAFKGANLDRAALYRKCAHCHLFVEEQSPEDVAEGLARYIHNHRGDDADEALDESHAAEPEPGPGAPLTWWKLNGPAAMRSRFIDDETVDVLGGPLPRGRCDECGAPCDALTGKCMREPEKHLVAQSGEEPDTCLAPDGHWYVITYGRARWQIHAKDCATCRQNDHAPTPQED